VLAGWPTGAQEDKNKNAVKDLMLVMSAPILTM